MPPGSMETLRMHGHGRHAKVTGPMHRLRPELGICYQEPQTLSESLGAQRCSTPTPSAGLVCT